MDYKKSHTAIFSNPIQFLFPDINIFLLQQDKEQKILGQGIGQFDISFMIVAIADTQKGNMVPTPSG